VPGQALVLVDGIPDSPLSGYFQVKRALIAFNTFVDCREYLEIGNGKGSSGRALPPSDVTFANNLALGTGESPIVKVSDQPINATWEGNLFGPGGPGIDVSGIVRATVQFEKSEGLLRPRVGSAGIDAAVGQYGDIETDIDGQERKGALDVGCDEMSDGPKGFRPLHRADVGPSWYND
jgi:poly(beta-D-mannuronate) lyase